MIVFSRSAGEAWQGVGEAPADLGRYPIDLGTDPSQTRKTWIDLMDTERPRHVKSELSRAASHLERVKTESLDLY